MGGWGNLTLPSPLSAWYHHDLAVTAMWFYNFIQINHVMLNNRKLKLSMHWSKHKSPIRLKLYCNRPISNQNILCLIKIQVRILTNNCKCCKVKDPQCFYFLQHNQLTIIFNNICRYFKLHCWSNLSDLSIDISHNYRKNSWQIKECCTFFV